MKIAINKNGITQWTDENSKVYVHEPTWQVRSNLPFFKNSIINWETKYISQHYIELCQPDGERRTIHFNDTANRYSIMPNDAFDHVKKLENQAKTLRLKAYELELAAIEFVKTELPYWEKLTVEIAKENFEVIKGKTKEEAIKEAKL